MVVSAGQLTDLNVSLSGDFTDMEEFVVQDMLQLGGGTDISAALGYCRQLITRPNDTVLVLISDLFEGGNAELMYRRVGELVAVARLLAVDDTVTALVAAGGVEGLAVALALEDPARVALRHAGLVAELGRVARLVWIDHPVVVARAGRAVVGRQLHGESPGGSSAREHVRRTRIETLVVIHGSRDYAGVFIKGDIVAK